MTHSLRKHFSKFFINAFLLLSISSATPAIFAQTDNTLTTVPVEDIQRFAEVISQIKQFYIEPITDQKLFNNAIKGMLSNLDPHSAYLDTSDLRDLQTVTTGEFGGIGVEVMPENGFLKVVSPLDDSPAARANIKPGDLIVRIDNKLVKDITIEQAITMIRGKKGSTVKLTLIRKGETKPITLTLTRENVKVQAVKSKMLENGYGYVRIAFFQNSVKPDMEKSIKQLQQQSGGQLKGLILDLRNDPGGLFESAVEVADEFLEPSKMKNNNLIVYTKGRIKGQDMEAKATGGDILNGVPMIVLINEGSASASEIVAGALQDHKRALIVGTKSFGKGSVQTVIPIDNQSAIKLTTALYYTPAGRSIQAKGIQPDVIIADLKLAKGKGQDVVIAPIEEADLDHHLSNGDKDKNDNADKAATPADSTATPGLTISEKEKRENEAMIKQEKELAQTDFQLYQALNLLKGLNAARL